jgi:tRNA nucleotidyltransferase/poly(A) polymerase
MEPLQTFLDDPLRVLRLVRFASRLGFRIDAQAEEVMGDERVLGNLRVKISRERIGVELEKMMKGGFNLCCYWVLGMGLLTLLSQANDPSSRCG